MTPEEAVAKHVHARLVASSSLVAIVGSSIRKGRLEQDDTAPGIVHSLVTGDPTLYSGANNGNDPRMGLTTVLYQVKAVDQGESGLASYEVCYSILGLVRTALKASGTQGDQTIYPAVPGLCLESEYELLGERELSVLQEFSFLVAATVGTGA